MAAYLRHYPRYYGDMIIRDVGLIASEGRMTIPVADGTPAGILDITTHYFEFIPEAELNSPCPTVLAAHELREGATYYILPTTSYPLVSAVTPQANEVLAPVARCVQEH